MPNKSTEEACPFFSSPNGDALQTPDTSSALSPINWWNLEGFRNRYWML